MVINDLARVTYAVMTKGTGALREWHDDVIAQLAVATLGAAAIECDSEDGNRTDGTGNVRTRYPLDSAYPVAARHGLGVRRR